MELYRGTAKKQKWIMKKTYNNPWQFYDFSTDMGADAFLVSVSTKEEEAWWPDLQQQQKKAEACGGEKWYFVYSGENCGLYKNYGNFIAGRDDENGVSKKSTMFYSLEEAKTWIQGSRDEEGVHWRWPNPMPIWFVLKNSEE